MDLLEIRKKAKEKKAAEEAAGRVAAAEGKAPDTLEAVPAEEGHAVEAGPEKPARKQKKKAPPKPPPAPGPAPIPGQSDADEAGPVPVSVAGTEVAGTPAPLKEAAPPPSLPGEEDELSGYLAGEGPSEEDVVEYLAFMLGSEEYAVKVEDVREIIRLQQITKVPRAAGFVKGIISLRGVIIPVFDIRKRLGLDEAEITRNTRIIVVSDDGSPQGIMVDRVTGVARLRADGIEPTPAVIGGVEAEYLDGVGRHGERLLILFNTSRVLTMEGPAS